MTYLWMAAAVFGINLIPAFGPPTWAVLVLFYLRDDLSEVLLVPTGAVAAAAGRLALAVGTRALGRHLPAGRRHNLTAAGSVLMRRRAGSVAGLMLFALSPIPSAQLFEAAGLMQVRLVPLTASFFAGRLVSYSLYLGGAHLVKGTSTADLMTSTLTSPAGVLLEVAMLAGLVALSQVDWSKHLRSAAPSDEANTQQSPGLSSLSAAPRPRDAGHDSKTRYAGRTEEDFMKLSAQTRIRRAHPARVEVHTTTGRPPSTSVGRRYLLAALRLSLGWVFLWAFLDKTFGLGHDTTSKQAWIHGGSPTYGFLHFSAKGPFAGLYKDIAGQGWADWLFMLGLLGIGIGLCVGVAMRASAVAAAIMLVLMWSVVLPPANNPFMDDHLIYAIAVLALPVLHADEAWGLGAWWKRTDIVRRFPILG